MIVFNGFKLIGLAIMTASFLLCVIVNIIDRIVCSVKKRKDRK